MHTPASASDELIRDGHPNWPAIDFEVLCPRCNYNLRMLTAPRCPECGLDFDWTLVLRQSTSVSDFLFEHHWRRRPIRSFLTTVWRSLRPVKFWRSVSIYDRVRPGPLVLVMLIAPAVVFGFLHMVAALCALLTEVIWGPGLSRLYYQANSVRAYSWAQTLMSMSQLNPSPWSSIHPAIRWFIQAVAFVLVQFGLILGLRQTLGRCQVRSIQILRVIAYGAIPTALFQSFLITSMIFAGALCDAHNYWEKIAVESALWLVGGSLAVAIPTIYLNAGLHCYLRLPRAVWIAFAASLSATLSAAILGMNL